MSIRAGNPRIMAVIALSVAAGVTPERVEAQGIGGFAPIYHARPDFNGDWRGDLAVKVPGEDFSTTVFDSGAVNVIHGSTSGLTYLKDQIWTQDTPGIQDAVRSYDRFSHALAWGDFNRDGYDDLAVGVPGENVGTIQNAGAVHVIYGSAAGLAYSGAVYNQFFHQDTAGIEDAAEPEDHFGASLAAADFNGDGYCDLAIGVPGESVPFFPVPPMPFAGAVNVIYGSSTGLSPDRQALDQIWYEGIPFFGIPSQGSGFGFSLVAGDFDQDGNADLAIGVPRRDATWNGATYTDAGTVHVLYGNAAGLRIDRHLMWSGSGPLKAGGLFSYCLTTGDLDGDGYTDLAVGSWSTDRVEIIYGSATGLMTASATIWDSPFTRTLASGDFDSDGIDDLAGAGSNISNRETTVRVRFNDRSRSPSLSTFVDLVSSAFVPHGSTEMYFEVRALSVGDFNGDSYADLCVGMPERNVMVPDINEDLTAAATSYDGQWGKGAMLVLYGATRADALKRAEEWHQNARGIEDKAEFTDFFAGTNPNRPFEMLEPLGSN